MEERVEDVGGLVEKSRTKIWLLGYNHVDWRRRAFNKISKQFQPES
jgi:hypothetical protein